MINPVRVDKAVDLFWAQPVTFETMRIAKEHAGDAVDVTLLSTQYKEDEDFVPDFYKKTENLERSVLDVADFYKKRKLPLLKDILDKLYSSSDADYLIFSNCDIALMPYFYTAVAQIIEEGYDAFVINRRTISTTYSTVEDIPFMYAAAGQPHKGFDCFVFKRELYPDFELGNVCVGVQAVGRLLVWNLVSTAKKYKEFKDSHLTFHFGDERRWKKHGFEDYKIHNRKEAQCALKRINDKFSSIAKLKELGYQGTFVPLGKKKQVNFKNNKFIFIAGLHRSGTTVLADCLREHPQVSGFSGTGLPEDEGQFLQSVFPLAWRYGGPGKFGFSKEMHLTEESELVTAENREKISFEWGQHWDLTKPFLLEKSPPNILKTRFLQALFPDSYFIVIMRHPIANAYANQKWSQTGIYSLLEHWLACYRIFDRDKQHLKNLLFLRYEDFVNAPDVYLEKIYRFLELPKHPRTIEVKRGVDERYFAHWQEIVDRRRGLMKKLRALKYRKIEKGVNRFDYSLYKLLPHQP